MREKTTINALISVGKWLQIAQLSVSLWRMGTLGGQTYSQIATYRNREGLPAAVQADDDLYAKAAQSATISLIAI